MHNKLELVDRFFNAAETISTSIDNAELTDEGNVRYTCLCGRVIFSELKEVGRIKSCDCGRCYAVPSPVSLPLLEGTASVRQHCRELKNGSILVWNTPIVVKDEFFKATMPKQVVPLVKRRRITWGLVGVFFLGCSIGMLAIMVSIRLGVR